MYIKIKNKRINFNNVVSYKPMSKLIYGKNNHYEHYLSLDTLGDDVNYEKQSIKFDTLIEVNAIIKELDELLEVKSI